MIPLVFHWYYNEIPVEYHRNFGWMLLESQLNWLGIPVENLYSTPLEYLWNTTGILSGIPLDCCSRTFSLDFNWNTTPVNV